MPIYQRGRSFQAALNHPSLPRGRLRLSFATFADAEDWERRARNARDAGRSVAALKAMAAGLPETMGKLLAKVENERWSRMKGAKSLILNGRHVVQLIGQNVCPADVSVANVETAIQALKDAGNSNATINRKLAALSTMLTVFQKLTGTKKLSLPRLKETEHRVRCMSEEEQAQATQACREMGELDVLDALLVAVDTGLRTRVELLTLRPSNVVLVEGKPTAVTGACGRIVPLTERAAAIIERRAVTLFSGITYERLCEVWDQLARTMGLEQDEQFTPSVLRDTFCCRLVKNGVPLVTVRELAGHANIKTTLRYAHLSPNTYYASAIKTLEASR